MAKRGWRGKERPKKVIPVASVSSKPENVEGECSITEKFNETVTMEDTESEEEVEILEKKLVADTDLEEGRMPQDQAEQVPLRNQGMKLGYVAPPLKHGIPTACLMKSELEREAQKWRCAIILYVIGDTPTITYLTTFLKKQCQIVNPFEIFYHNDGYFVIKFATIEENDRILCTGPYTLANRPVIVKQWELKICFEKEILREVPLWIQLPKLPLHCWSGDSLSRIGSVLGTPICTDECTTQQKRISYARMLVEIDVTQPLKYSVSIADEEGKMVEQKVYYEWVPLFCKKCQIVGHVCRENDGKKDINRAPLTQKQWMPKERDKGKEIVQNNEIDQQKMKETEKKEGTRGWNLPKKTTSNAVIQVGHLQINTNNAYSAIEEDGDGSTSNKQGGDLLPLLQR